MPKNKRQDEFVRMLKKISLFKSLEQNDLQRIVSLARVHRVKKGEVIFEAKTMGNHLFIMLSGRVKIFRGIPPSRRKKTFGYLKRGEFFGEIALLDPRGRSLSACAIEDAELLTISRKEFLRLVAKRPDFGVKIMKTLCERLRNANEEIEYLTFKSLYGRVCRKLLHIFMRDSGKNKEGDLVSSEMTHSELADYAGTARELVTKVLSSLKKQKIINYEDHKIKLNNPNKLRELAQFDAQRPTIFK
ncbi:Crp/Fnr family transcriptional regulator [Elusimicrobiota bacterium]